MKFDDSFFMEEEFNGFKVSSLMKRCWAAQMEVLEDFDAVCRELGIKYYLAYGTLLGAVRHQGFIPWDDDMDVFMLHEDVVRLLKEAEEPLKVRGLELATPYNDHTLRNLAYRVINTRDIRLDERFLVKYHLFPFMAGLDIFPLNYVPKDATKKNDMKNLVYAANVLAQFWNNPEADEAEKWDTYKMLTNMLGMKQETDKSKVEGQLWEISDRIISMYGPRDSSMVANVTFYFNNNKQLFPKAWFGTPKYMRFGNGEFPVPQEYDKVLTEIYGADYMTPINEGGVHDYPYYRNYHKDLINFFNENNIKCPSIYANL